MVNYRRLAWAAAFVALCCLSNPGCRRSGPERVVVSGTVTYQGQPVQDGRIRFLPMEGTEAPMSGGYISGGRYRADARGGVPVGTHRVEITAFRVHPQYTHLADDDAPLGAAEELPSEQYLPARYNSDSELTMTVPSGSRRIEENFEL